MASCWGLIVALLALNAGLSGKQENMIQGSSNKEGVKNLRLQQVKKMDLE